MTHTEKTKEIAGLLNKHIEKLLEFNKAKREDNIYEFIEAVVKLWDEHDISQQRELLLAFRKKLNESRIKDRIYIDEIDDFLGRQ